MIEILKQLCALSGVSGDEGEVRDYIVDFVRKHTDDVTVDVMGNVIVAKKGAKTPVQKITLCAHMDEVGIIVTGITKEGYLKFAAAGVIDKRVLVGKVVTFGKNRLSGLIGCKAIHLVKSKDREKVIDISDMYIDIGATNREDAEKLVSLGSTGAFDDDIQGFGDGYIKAKAIDDRIGCAIMMELISSDLPVDCTFAFTVQEEVGLRGAQTVAYRTAPDIALIIEGTTAGDLPSVPENKKICKAGAGVVIPFMDGGSIYNKEIRGVLTDLAEKNNIKWQTKNVVAGSTDGAAFQRSRGGVKTVGIAAPIRNLHSQACVGKISDMEDVMKLARLFLDWAAQ